MRVIRASALAVARAIVATLESAAILMSLSMVAPLFRQTQTWAAQPIKVRGDAEGAFGQAKAVKWHCTSFAAVQQNPTLMQSLRTCRRPGGGSGTRAYGTELA